MKCLFLSGLMLVQFACNVIEKQFDDLSDEEILAAKEKIKTQKNNKEASPQQNTQSKGGTRGSVSFKDEIVPIIEAKCLECHDIENAKGGLNLSSYTLLMAGGLSGNNVVPGNPEESLLIRLLYGQVGEIVEMPKGRILKEEQRDLLEKWVKEGALNN